MKTVLKINNDGPDVSVGLMLKAIEMADVVIGNGNVQDKNKLWKWIFDNYCG